MNDSTTLGLASTAVGLVNGTIGLLKEARDAAKRSDDHGLKDKLSEVFDAVLELKEVVGNLRDENAWDTARKLYFAEGDPDPFCPACLWMGYLPSTTIAPTQKRRSTKPMLKDSSTGRES